MKMTPAGRTPRRGFRAALTSVAAVTTVPRMDTMKLLLGATIALLLGALVMSWQGMRQGVANAPADELARLRKQVDELRIEQERIQLEKQYQQLRDAPMAQSPTASSVEMEAMKAELAAKEAALREIEEEKSRAERDAQTYKEEAGLVGQVILERKDNELRRARMIRDALLIGRVKEYVDDAEYGGFVTIELLMPENVQSGINLAIRRQTGILGQLKISSIEGTEAIGNLMPGFGQIQPVPGDELIMPPQF
jgi:hypothetical protein